MAIKSWLILGACLLFLQGFAKAESVYTTVFNVLESKRSDSILILSGVDGRTYKTTRSDENLLRMNSFKGQIVRLDYQLSEGQAYITAIRLANQHEIDPATMDLNYFQYDQLRRFAPTDLQSEDKADHVFKTMINDGDKRSSQCFKRAHMWAFDMWSKLGISSEKVFMFYTQRYITINEFKWWFHVAPLVTVNGDPFVMDGTFMSKPTPLKSWLAFFMQTDKVTCPLIEKYQDFEDHQWSRLCYAMRTPMYYFRPADMEARDKKGEEKTFWVIDELQDARRAFKHWEDIYEGLDSGTKPIKY